MENIQEIKNLKELLQKFLGRDITISESTIKPLTSVGDNYGSQMLAVEIKFKDNKLKEEILNLVAKMCPPSEFLKQIFDTAITFKKEAAIYSVIVPTLREFLQEQGVADVMNFFPDCYGTCISSDPNSDIVDDDSVILMENLKLSGYAVGDRMKGFDLETTRLILKDLAVFHAVPIALKLLKPDVFKDKVLPNLTRTLLFDYLSEESRQAAIDFMVDTIKVNPECVPFVPNAIKSMKTGLNSIRIPPPILEPFATINHNDYWVNNTMLRYENNNPVQNKMLDFQIIDYGSPSNDIVFFLFTSVQKQVLDLHYDSLIKLYYSTFINTLKNLKCDTTRFTFESLQEQIDDCAKTTQFFHIMIMLKPIFAVKGKIRELSELTEEDFSSDTLVSEECKQKVIDTVLYFAKNKWI